MCVEKKVTHEVKEYKLLRHIFLHEMPLLMATDIEI